MGVIDEGSIAVSEKLYRELCSACRFWRMDDGTQRRLLEPGVGGNVDHSALNARGAIRPADGLGGRGTGA